MTMDMWKIIGVGGSCDIFCGSHVQWPIDDAVAVTEFGKLWLLGECAWAIILIWAHLGVAILGAWAIILIWAHLGVAILEVRGRLRLLYVVWCKYSVSLLSSNVNTLR
nr:hypothetical protein CFP56_48555 [Quercus suber]